MAVSGLTSSTSESRMRTRMGSPDSKQRVSIVTSLPGKSWLTASDSIPYWPYHFWTPSTLMALWLGRFWKGDHAPTKSVSGVSQANAKGGSGVF